MNALVKLGTLCVAAMLLVEGCGQSGSGSTSSEPIKIKGLYIGMDIQTVPALLKEQFASQTLKISDVIKGDTAGFTAVSEPDNCYVTVSGGFPLPLGLVIAGADGKVKSVGLDEMLVKEMFKAEEMEASDFVKQFIKAYNIPQMKVADDMESWTYTSPNGEKISISAKKRLDIEKVASAKEKKQAFN